MGSIAVFLYKHARALVCWTIIVGALALAVDAMYNSTAYESIGDFLIDASNALAEVVTAVPRMVRQVNEAVSYTANDSDMAAFLYWISGFDQIQFMLSFIAAQISAIISAIVIILGATTVLFSIVWVLRRAVRFVSAMSQGEVTGEGIAS